jgi:hypothetical protein
LSEVETRSTGLLFCRMSLKPGFNYAQVLTAILV